MDWEERVKKALVGRTIVGVEWMTEEEAGESGWYSRPPILILDDGHSIYPMADDEGNNGGALATTYEDLSTVPVF